MTKIHSGSIFGAAELTAPQRDAARLRLEWLETDLVRRRKRLAYWAVCKSRAETVAGIPEDLRQGALYFYRRAQELVSSGEKLRAYLIAELQDQPEHRPAYYYEH